MSLAGWALAAEIPTAVSALEIARIWIEIGTVNTAAIVVPGRAPWRRPVGGRAVIGGRRRRHIDGARGECAADHGADAEAEQARAPGVAAIAAVIIIAATSLCRGRHGQRTQADQRSGGDRFRGCH